VALLSLTKLFCSIAQELTVHVHYVALDKHVVNVKTYPKNTSFGSIEVTVGSGVNMKIPLGPVGVKPSNDKVTPVLAFIILFLLPGDRLITHGTLVFVTL